MRFAKVAILLLLVACGSTAPEPLAAVDAHRSDDVDVSLFLVGDAGLGPTPLLAALGDAISARVAEVGADRVAVVFLGDNVYWTGVPASATSSKELDAQVAAARAAGTIVFVPGNHDWNYNGRDGWPRIRRQGELLERANARLLPRNGCPGPELVDIGSRLRILAIDTQWWLHTREKPGPKDCAPGTPEDFLRTLTSLIHRERDTIVVAHHPILSGGHHGHYGLSSQDQLSSANREMREQLQKAMSAAARPPLAYASGHEHTLEVLRGNSARYLLVSGGGKYRDQERVKQRTASEGTWLFGRASGRPQGGWMRVDFPRNGTPRLGVFEFREGAVSEAFSTMLE